MDDFESCDGGAFPPDATKASALPGGGAIYCISLREQPERAQAAMAHFRALHLDPYVTMYRPRRGLNAPRAIWESHRNVALRALAMGHDRVLILEDDARFVIALGPLKDRVARAIGNAPKEWRGLYLCHLPVQAYPIATNLLRVRSCGAFAYIANRPLLEWLAATEPMDPEIPVCDIVGPTIDGAFANLPGMYAVFPMAARHVDVGGRRADCERPTILSPSVLFDKLFYRDFLLFRYVRVSDFVAMALSPWHALTLEFFRRRSGAALAEKARRLRECGGFDATNYLRANPDVAAAGLEPLGHYLRIGAAEGRDPMPPLNGFDPALYLAANPDVAAAGIDPVAHYLSFGRAERRALAPREPKPGSPPRVEPR